MIWNNKNKRDQKVNLQKISHHQILVRRNSL